MPPSEQPINELPTLAQTSLSLIDTDVHTALNHMDELKPYLPAYYRNLTLDLPGRAGFLSPIGVQRQDAIPEEGGIPGSSVSMMQKQLLDAYQMDYAILNDSSMLGISVHADANYAAVLARAYNDYFAENWLEKDPRILGCVLIAHNNPTEAAKEIKRIGGHRKIVQVIMSSASRSPLGERQYWPIYDAACEMNLPVAVHPGAECSGVANPFTAGFPTSYFEWHNNLSQNYMCQLNSMICQGVFNQFPNLKLVCIEGGIGWLPHLMWRMDKNWKALRFTVPWLDRQPSQCILEHVRLTTQPIEEPENRQHLLQILEMVHAEKTVMFSSDYPHWDGDCPVHGLPRLPEAMKQAIMFGNAQALYNL